jgi:hypothetical protein
MQRLCRNHLTVRELLSLSYQVRGLPEADAVQFVAHLAKEKKQLIRALASSGLESSVLEPISALP